MTSISVAGIQKHQARLNPKRLSPHLRVSKEGIILRKASVQPERSNNLLHPHHHHRHPHLPPCPPPSYPARPSPPPSPPPSKVEDTTEYKTCIENIACTDACSNLNLANRHLTGTLPTELGSLVSLTTL
ncbi:hypothetical protein CYMTET_54461 [Cymbomonas tetramitiformis]|uniref:Uncharacterized protein n=1 Tax=Cymbomonas tetramitiformis TaxID=36881 RepID=A0AAE0BGP8_9CHLO|nr:hypothetical protein CYMTET_54461 [Cymbomonas tetramitiformis]